MNHSPLRFVIALAFNLSLVLRALADGTYHDVSFPASKAEGELVYPVTYRMWLPENVKTVRGIIVHQHGCGVGSRNGAEPDAKDLRAGALEEAGWPAGVR